jgi:hypothetical protein
MGWGRVRSKDAQELCQLTRMILFAVMRAVVYFIDVTTPSIRWKIRNFPFPAFLQDRNAILGLRGTSSSRCRLLRALQQLLNGPTGQARRHSKTPWKQGHALQAIVRALRLVRLQCECRGFRAIEVVATCALNVWAMGYDACP